MGKRGEAKRTVEKAFEQLRRDIDSEPFVKSAAALAEEHLRRTREQR